MKIRNGEIPEFGVLAKSYSRSAGPGRRDGSQERTGRFSEPYTTAKNPTRFHEYKHTSLIFLVGGFSVNRLPLG
jgi:hypothetical protein